MQIFVDEVLFLSGFRLSTQNLLRKISLRFASRPPLRFASRPHCVLLPRAITGGFASQDLTAHLLAFCFQDLTRVFASKLSLRFASTSLRFAQDLHCILLEDHIAGKENGLQILQSIDQGPFELRTTRDALGTTPEGGVLLGPERPRTYEDLSHHMRNIRMTMPNIQLNSKFVNNMSPEWDRITPATNEQLAFVTTVQPHAPILHVQSHQYPSSSTNPQSPQYPQFPETSQIDSGYTQTDEILDNLTKQMALLAQSFRATLPQTNNQLRTSSNTQNQATIQSVGLYSRSSRGDRIKSEMLLMQAQENGAVLDEDELLFLAGEQGNTFDADVDNQPVQDLAPNEDNIF
ncbi:hypothetical protein Tco_1514531 [Tanacetum coccineum]